MTESSITLSSLNTKIKEATENAFPKSVWVIAEILEMQINRSGHCYLELIEKSETDNSIIAKSRATIWSSKFNMIRSYFETTTRAKLKSGIKVLVKASISFHGIYGLSLNISDIDPNFTIGDLAVKKQEVINRLHASGVIDMNKELPLAEVPQRIAVISSETAAGYGDFIDSLLNNSVGFSFKVTLFPAVVQGNEAEQSIISSLEKIFDLDTSFDVVVLIRGGGSQADLDCFNGYDLAMNIAQFPIPVLTGIGHERDETIADIVAYQSLKTPTAVAEYLLDMMLEFSDRIYQLKDRFEQTISWIMQEKRMELQQKASELNHQVKQQLSKRINEINSFQLSLKRIVQQELKDQDMHMHNSSRKLTYLWRGLFDLQKRNLETLTEKNRRVTTDTIKTNYSKIEVLEKSMQLLRPEKVLARGYSISSIDGKTIKSVEDLKIGSKIETKIADGTIGSIIENVEDLRK